MLQTKIAEKIKTHFMCKSTNFSKNCAVNEMWKNVVEPDRPQMLLHMHFACRITKAIWGVVLESSCTWVNTV